MKAGKYNTFIGIDVSKDKLDLCLTNAEGKSGFVIENSPSGLSAAFKTTTGLGAVKLSKTLFCFEHMDVYNSFLIACLIKRKAAFSIQSPLHIKLSMGLVRGKSDKLDAERIASFAQKNQTILKLWQQPRAVITQLEGLKSLRRRLINMRIVLSQPIGESEHFSLGKKAPFPTTGCSATLAALKADINGVETEIKELIMEDERLNRLYQFITSVDGVGFVIALSLIVLTNEFKKFNTTVNNFFHNCEHFDIVLFIPYGSTSSKRLLMSKGQLLKSLKGLLF